ncbi:MAG: T9SS type A sorting domain-containing protein [Candidatus Eisenbacteria bacterium]|nr:T9SS type A sorting domain-containing protein [Candidatus Eisenbacteria bacterium]
MSLAVSPSPFRAGGAFRLTLERRGELAVEVLDAVGRRVRQVFHGELPAGTSTLRWDGRDALGAPQPAGVYFVRVWADGGQLAKTVVLLR